MEAYRNLPELVCEATLGSQVWRHVNCAIVSSYEEIPCIPKHQLYVCNSVEVNFGDVASQIRLKP